MVQHAKLYLFDGARLVQKTTSRKIGKIFGITSWELMKRINANRGVYNFENYYAVKVCDIKAMNRYMATLIFDLTEKTDDDNKYKKNLSETIKKLLTF